MPQIKIDCPRCEGDGKIPITAHLQATLKSIPVDGAFAGELAHSLDCEATAVSNRLVRLLLLGLVKRQRDGKYWLYTRTTKLGAGPARRTRK